MTNTLAAAPPLARWAVVAAWMLLIFSLSAQSESGEHSRSLVGSLFALFGWSGDDASLRPYEFALRKGAHFTEYAVLAGLLYWALPGHGLGRLAAAWAIATGYAASDEWHQAFVPHRGPSPTDVAIDSAGAATALALIAALKAPWRRR